MARCVYLLSLLTLHLQALNTYASIHLNEFMAANQTVVSDAQGEYDDWIELYNSGTQAVDVGGWYLSDDAYEPTKWQIPTDAPAETTIAARGYRMFWADGDPNDGPRHLDFRLRSGGEAIVLLHYDGVTVVDALDFGSQMTDISQGRLPNGGEVLHFFADPTPGHSNSESLDAFTEPIRFSHSAGTFQDSFQLQLHGGDPHLSIHYTLNNRLPDERSPYYTGPLDINRTTTVRAGLFDSRGQIGPIVSRVFIRIDADLAPFTSNLPILVIEAYGHDFVPETDPRAEYLDVAVVATLLEAPTEGQRVSILGPVHFAGRAAMHTRGASTRAWDKKSYKFETWDENDRDQDVSILGMPADSDWILFAPYFDRSLIRNHLTYTWFGRLGHYSPRMRWVEAFINMDGDIAIGREDYVGLYQIVEQVKRGKDRVDITRMRLDDVTEPEVTGGYMLQATNINPDFLSYTGTRYKYVYPKRTDIAPSQGQFIQNTMNTIQSVIDSSSFKDPDTGYPLWLEMASCIDYDIMRELTRNIDGASTYMSLDRGGKLKLGPLWDYDQSFGNTSLNNKSKSDYGWEPEGWNQYYMKNSHWLKWWNRLDDDPAYQQQWNDRWKSLRQDTLATHNLLAEIDDLVSLLDETQQRNFERWPILGTEVWKNREAPNWRQRRTYIDEITWLKDWLQTRLAWIDIQIDANKGSGGRTGRPTR